MLDVKATCERREDDKVLFLGPHSPFSNLYSAEFRVDNMSYSCVEQYLQSSKASAFNDDVIQAKIMKESNPFRMKQLGSKVNNFNLEVWKRQCKTHLYKAVLAKFSQNNNLRSLLLATGK